MQHSFIISFLGSFYIALLSEKRMNLSLYSHVHSAVTFGSDPLTE
jgi:hypothetical protein